VTAHAAPHLVLQLVRCHGGPDIRDPARRAIGGARWQAPADRWALTMRAADANVVTLWTARYSPWLA
jgi:hypothetical protein